jgi:BirA family biotin operon repressor/biotin-[acetyl-CoA-carboxylase] ligase
MSSRPRGERQSCCAPLACGICPDEVVGPPLSTPAELESTIADIIVSRGESKFLLSELAAAVQASPARTREAIRQLKTLGYQLRLSRNGIIEHLPFKPIDQHRLRGELATRRIGRSIEWRLCVRSTQDELSRLKNEALDGTVLIAETQYGGRGRRGRSWSSAVGGIWMSVLLRPTWPGSHQILPLAFAVAAARAIGGAAGVSSVIKWPNDLLVRSRKIAGLLAEAAYEGNQLRHLILGLGVNANVQMRHLPKQLRAVSTSLSRELGREIDRTLLARIIIQEMDNSYQRFESGRASELLDEVKHLCSTLGRTVRVSTAEKEFVGRALDLGVDGQLLVRLNSGVTVPFYAADVVHIR